MDDLLIVRMSDRSKERFNHRRERTPIGANLGLLLGIGLGIAISFELYPGNQRAAAIGAVIGLTLGIAMGGILGRFVNPKSSHRRKPRPDLYDGLPFSNEEEVTEESAQTLKG